MTLDRVRVAFELHPFDAEDLAQFLKRLCWEDVERRMTGKEETHGALEGVRVVQGALARAGFNPR